MNYGGDAADQIVRYSLDGVDHGLRLSGTLAKHLAVFVAAVLKDQKKTRGKTRMVRMLKENKPLKFFTVPSDRLREFCSEGRKRGLLYVIIQDKKNPEMSEVMVFADDAAKVNRVMDKMNLDFVRSEVGEAVHEVTAGMEAPETEAVQETVQMPEGEVQFEISDLDEAFQVGDMDFSEEEKNQNHPEKEFSEPENFIPVQEEGEENLSGSSLHSRNISTGQEKGTDAGQRDQERPSVRRELENIKREKAEESQKRSREKNRGPRKTQKKARKKRKVKAREEMDLTKFLGQDSQEQSAQRLSKEEYAAQKKQEREEIWGMIDGKAQEVFQNGDSLKGFLDFMGQCKPQRTDNLFLLYAQNPEIRQVKTFEKWKEEGKVVKTGSKGYNFIVGQEYEKDGVIQQGYSIQKAYDISQIRTKQPEEAEPKPMDQLMEALLTDSEVRIQIADNLPDKVQAQYIPNKRTIYVRNGMSENATFHSISRELACASLDHHDGSYSRAGVSAQAYCAAYVTAQKYGVDVSGFSFDKVCQMQVFGQKDPKELRSFIQDVKSAAYSIGKQVDRNLGKSEQEFMTDEFSIPEEKTEKPAKSKKSPER